MKLLPKDNCKIPNYLILAGDIGKNPTGFLPIGNPNNKDFLTEISQHYEKVLLVAGNYEYLHAEQQYDTLTVDDINNSISSITSSMSNVYFLNRTSIILNKTKFLGCTLWTNTITPAKYSTFSGLKSSKDFHDIDVSWLTDGLEPHGVLPDINGEFNKTVVITHHLPSYQLIADKYRKDPNIKFYASNLEHLVEKADIWCCGHSHSFRHITIGNCQCYLNPVGYSHELTGFNPSMEIIL